jgi:hypothetical protein
MKKTIKGIAALAAWNIGSIGLMIDYEALPIWAVAVGVGLFGLTSYLLGRAIKDGCLVWLKKLIDEV